MTTGTLLQPAIQDSVHHTQAEHIDQYTLWQILGIWALVALSTALLAFSPAPEQMNALSVSFMIGAPVFSWLPLISTVVFCVIFIAVAIWRFNRQEF
jgi:hypothetical protein